MPWAGGDIMPKFKEGDYVVRKSYGKDILFRVIEVINSTRGSIVVLKGVDLRIVADAPEDDLELQTRDGARKYRSSFDEKIEKCMENTRSGCKRSKCKSFFKRGLARQQDCYVKSAKVLHIDGDKEYLDICLENYKKLEIEAVGKAIDEKDQARHVVSLLKEHNPDILVLTGHDGLIKGFNDLSSINGYRNSKYFVNAVKAARTYESSLDELVIFAGACQSHYEEILEAGANFASSPHRVLIHCLDPVFICEKIAYGPADRFVSLDELITNTITGVKGIGGIQTRGKQRQICPKSPYS